MDIGYRYLTFNDQELKTGSKKRSPEPDYVMTFSLDSIVLLLWHHCKDLVQILRYCISFNSLMDKKKKKLQGSSIFLYFCCQVFAHGTDIVLL